MLRPTGLKFSGGGLGEFGEDQSKTPPIGLKIVKNGVFLARKLMELQA